MEEQISMMKRIRNFNEYGLEPKDMVPEIEQRYKTEDKQGFKQVYRALYSAMVKFDITKTASEMRLTLDNIIVEAIHKTSDYKKIGDFVEKSIGHEIRKSEINHYI